MPVNLKKFVTNSLPEFLLLVLDPSTVFANDDGTVERLGSVVVCYDVQKFYKNLKIIEIKTVDPVGLDEFVLYCESKIQSKFTTDGKPLADYQCCMTVSDLIRMEMWTRLYDVVGPNFMKFLLFGCLLFVPLRENVYYCVHTPSQQSDRYEVLQSFRVRAGKRWINMKVRNNNLNNSSCSRLKQTCFTIGGLLKDLVKPICQTGVDDMLREILRDEGSGLNKLNRECLVGFKLKLKAMADKDVLSTYKNIYKSLITGNSAMAGVEIPLGRVKRFAQAVVRKIVPLELFGVAGNRHQYCENLGKVLNCGLFQNFTVEQIVHKIKVKKIKWLDAVTDVSQRPDVMSKFLVWLTNVFVFGRIAHFFQIVTTNTPNNGVAYYAKAGWATVCHQKISPLMSGDSEFFKELPANDISNKRTWNVCPYVKPNGVRLIFKLQRQNNGIEKQLMDNCLTFLRCLARTYPAEYRSVTKPQFFRGWKAWQESRPAPRRQSSATVYYVRTDFRDAFTSFVQDKLQTVVRDRIKDSYGKSSRMLSVHTVDVVRIGGGRSQNNVYCKKRKYFDGLPVPEFPGGSLVFYDQTATVTLARIWDAVRKCIRCNVVERGGRRWAMTRGIVQGDRLSVVLCDLLLADLQATCLKHSLVDAAGGRSGRLYRFVDDYVFVSSDRCAARRFLDAMLAGFDEYGLCVNRSKTETNVDGDGMDVRFLGFRLNATTGEVTKDLSAFRNRRPLHFFHMGLGGGRSGRTLFAKMTGPNQHPVPEVLVSGSFNTVATVVRNLASVVAYKAFAVVSAIKQYFFHVNPAFLVRTVHAVARLMYAKLCGLVRHSAVAPMQCKWIVYEVYVRMLSKHLPADVRIAWTVDRLRGLQTAVGRKCQTRDLKTALKHHDFTKMFG